MSKEEIYKLLEKQGKKPIAFYSTFAQALGGINEAIFVQQLLYWSDKGKREDGFIYKTQKELQEETYLTKSQQNKVKQKLKDTEILETKILKVGTAPVLHYKIYAEKLYFLILESKETLLSIKVIKSNFPPYTESTTEKANSLKKEFASYQESKTTDDERIVDNRESYKYEKESSEVVKRIAKHFKVLCKDDFNTIPLSNGSWYKQINRALSTGGLTEKQIYKLFDEWFTQGLPDGQMISLNRALSDNQISSFKVNEGIH